MAGNIFRPWESAAASTEEEPQQNQPEEPSRPTRTTAEEPRQDENQEPEEPHQLRTVTPPNMIIPSALDSHRVPTMFLPLHSTPVYPNHVAAVPVVHDARYPLAQIGMSPFAAVQSQNQLYAVNGCSSMYTPRVANVSVFPSPSSGNDSGFSSFNSSLGLASSLSHLQAIEGSLPRRRKGLSRRAVYLMEAWYSKNTQHPYPTRDEVLYMAHVGGITVNQVRKWMANKRVRTNNTSAALRAPTQSTPAASTTTSLPETSPASRLQDSGIEMRDDTQDSASINDSYSCNASLPTSSNGECTNASLPTNNRRESSETYPGSLPSTSKLFKWFQHYKDKPISTQDKMEMSSKMGLSLAKINQLHKSHSNRSRAQISNVHPQS